MDTKTDISSLDWSTGAEEPRAPVPPGTSETGTGATKFKSDETRSATATLPQSILMNWPDILQSGISPKLFDRIVRIALQPAGWSGPGSKSMRAESLKLFLTFWGAVRNEAAEPELALTASGSLQAEWFKSDRQRLDVTFAEPRLIFGLFATNSIVEGADSPTTVVPLLKGHPAKPLTWSP